MCGIGAHFVVTKNPPHVTGCHMGWVILSKCAHTTFMCQVMATSTAH